jgi:hypothetical protein
MSTADTIDGGAGTDILKLYSTVVMPQMTSIESIYFNGGGIAVDVSGKAATAIEIDNDTTATGSGSDSVTFAAGQTITLDSVVDSAAADGASGGIASGGGIIFNAAATVTSIDLVVDQVGSTTADLDGDIAGTGIKTVNITSSSTAGKSTDVNYFSVLNSGSAVRTINVDGATKLDASGDALTAVTTIDASNSTGGVVFDATGNSNDITFKGGSGNDVIDVGTSLDADDSLTGGDGTDTIRTGDNALTSATEASVKGVNAATGFERVMGDATEGAEFDMSKITGFTTVGSFGTTSITAGADGGSGAAGTDGTAGLNATAATSGLTLVVAGSITGGQGGSGGNDASGGVGASGGHGGDGITAALASNGSTDVVNLSFEAAATVTGGAGDSGGLMTSGGSSGADGDGGHGADLAQFEVINITTSAATSDVAFVSGAASGGGSAGDDMVVGANAVVTLSGAGDVDLGTVSTASTSSDDLTINGADMTGVLTVVTGAGDDTITGGSKADSITGGTGKNTLTGGGGRDTFVFANGDGTTTAFSTITDFNAGAEGDKLSFDGANSTTFVKITAAAQTAIDADTSLSAAVTEAMGVITADEATAFSYGGKTYVAFNNGADNTFAAGTDVLVLLTDVTVADMHADNIV